MSSNLAGKSPPETSDKNSYKKDPSPSEPFQPKTKTYPLIVDYSLPFKSHVTLGKYDQVHPKLMDAQFPIVGRGVVEVYVELFEMLCTSHTSHILRNAASHNLLQPSPEHILAFGAQYPEVQEKHTIVALFDKGKCWEYPAGNPSVLCLDFDRSNTKFKGRWLTLESLNREWPSQFRFLFLRANPYP